MKTITITEAKRSLGRYLKEAAAGKEIGIISGADIISLRKIEVVSAERVGKAPSRDWPEFPTFDGGPVDGAANHDKYIYDKPAPARRRKSHQ